MKFFRKKEVSYYSPAEIERRQADIPNTSNLPGFIKKSGPQLEFLEITEHLNLDKLVKKPLPASIEYLSFKREGLKKVAVVPHPDGHRLSQKFSDEGSNVSKSIKQNFVQELDDDSTFQFERTGHKDELSELSKKPEVAETEFAYTYFAEPEKIRELTELHMRLYSILSKIQETNISSDFRLAYDIQDRIAYILDNKTLLLKELVEELITYLKEIVSKLDNYRKEIHQKQLRFIEFNNKVSKLKEYKYKTDNSFKLMEENKLVAEQEIEKNQKILNGNN